MSAAKGVAFVVVALCGATAAQKAHQRVRPVENSAEVRQSVRLINADEGMAIIGAALEVRYRRHPREDCSHLVHDIYKRAGFPYPYADSSDLYRGIDAFRPVRQARPGDLAVWNGHAAIVVNPAQHTFFSSTRSGLRVESYDLKYWKRRGAPRFYRYATFAPPNLLSVTESGSRPASLHGADSHSEAADDAPTSEDDTGPN